MTETNDRPRTLDDTIRGWNDVLALWRLCRINKCAKARACRGAEARRCYWAHSCLLPESMLAWFYALADAQKEGLSYDQAMERMQGTEAENALEDWCEAIAYSEKVMKAGTLTWPPLKTD